ncbi:MAG TPA: hypothetical protein VGK99_16435 [Acidobacteriota bacterium]|jgi:hypothetical protein
MKRWVFVVTLAFVGASALLIWRHQRVAATLPKHEPVVTIEKTGDAFDWLTAAGPVDTKLQEDSWAWQQEAGRTRRRRFYAQDECQAWVFGESMNPPAALTGILSDYEADLDDLRRFLKQGSLRIGAAGWAAADKAAGKPPTAVRVSNTLIIRTAAQGLACSALLSHNPVDGLDDLDRLMRASWQPRTQVDLATSDAIYNIRDDTYLSLVLRDRLPETKLSAWSQEERPCVDWVADSVHTERLTLATIHPYFLAGVYVRVRGPRALLPAAKIALFGGNDLEIADRYLSQTESWIRNRQGSMPSAKLAAGGMLSALGRFTLTRGDEMLASCLRDKNRHRLFALGAKTVRLARKYRRLPRDESELLAWLQDRNALAQGIDLPQLRYENLDQAFRLSVDPNIPLPDYLRPSEPTRFGQPVHQSFWKQISPWNLELRFRM